MPGSYQIFTNRGLVYVRYDGLVTLSEAEELFADYMQQPEADLGQKQLIDLSRVTDWERDFPRLMSMQADKAGVFLQDHQEMFMVFYAPTEKSREFAKILTAPWRGVQGMVTSVQPEEAGILAILGQPEDRLSDLLKVKAA